MSDITRRGFMVGCSAAIAGLAGSRFNSLAFGAPGDQDVLVVVFLRGGMDGLNLMPPTSGADRGRYEAARPSLQIPTNGQGAALPLIPGFGWNPAAAPLLDLYQNGSLSIVQATGLGEATRSHFDSMEAMETGAPNGTHSVDGWLTRHLMSSMEIPDELVLPSLSMGSLQPTSLRGDRETVNINDTSTFSLNTGPWLWRSPQRAAVRSLYQADSSLVHVAGSQALDAVDIIELYAGGDYDPANGALYPNSGFGDHLQVIAQMIKLDLGLQVATLDIGGWDTHEGQNYPFNSLLTDLAEGLLALYTDLDGNGSQNYTGKLTAVVMSEFGRRFTENADDGTDHGHGNLMMVMSGNAEGGVHGTWPGLAPGQLFEGVDLAVTTDYRQILSEILIRRLGNNRLGIVFPGYGGYRPLGIVSGTDLTPDYKGGPGSAIFSDGFESGDTSQWS